MRRYAPLAATFAVLVLVAVSMAGAQAQNQGTTIPGAAASAVLVEVDERTLIPLDTLAPEFGAVVDWNRKTETVTLTVNKAIVEIPLLPGPIKINGNPVDVGAPAEVMKGRVMVPVRLIESLFGATVRHDPSTRTIRMAPAAGANPGLPKVAEMKAGGVQLPDDGVVFMFDGASHPVPVSANANTSGNPQGVGSPPPGESGEADPNPAPAPAFGGWPPEFAMRLEQRWPGAVLLPDGAARLPDGRIIDPASLDMMLRCDQEQPCPPLDAMLLCPPGEPCPIPMPMAGSGDPDAGPAGSPTGTP